MTVLSPLNIGTILTENVELPKYATLASRPAAATFGQGMCQVITALYTIIAVSDSSAWYSVGKSGSLTDRPAATTLGQGLWQVGETLYVSDGTSWRAATTATQAAKSANFTLAATDNNTQIPISAAITVTVDAGLATDFVTKLQNLGANTVTLSAGAGVTLWVNGASVASTTLTAKGSAMVIECSGTADEFFIYKAGS